MREMVSCAACIVSLSGGSLSSRQHRHSAGRKSDSEENRRCLWNDGPGVERACPACKAYACPVHSPTAFTSHHSPLPNRADATLRFLFPGALFSRQFSPCIAVCLTAHDTISHMLFVLRLVTRHSVLLLTTVCAELRGCCLCVCVCNGRVTRRLSSCPAPTYLDALPPTLRMPLHELTSRAPVPVRPGGAFVERGTAARLPASLQADPPQPHPRHEVRTRIRTLPGHATT